MVYFRFQSSPLMCISTLKSILHSLGYCTSVVSFEMGKCKFSNFALHFQDYCAYARVWNSWNPYAFWSECKTIQTLLKRVWQFSSQDLYIMVHKSVIHNNQRVETTQKSTLTGERIHKMWRIHIMEQYLVIRRNEELIHVAEWIDLESMLSERILSQKATYSMIPFIWDVQSRQIHRNRK